LVGGFLLYGLGAAVAALGGATCSARAYALGQAAVTAIQLMTHYANDYFDAAADRANLTPTRWSGGSRVLTSGALPDDVARTAVGKRTLVVRLGGRRSAALYRAWLVAVYGTIPLLLLGGLPPVVALAAVAGAPIGAWQFHRLGRGAWAEADAWEGMAFRAVVML